jgi:mannose-6-phosphate isomerase-like protein (cupin superfamily)
MKSNTVLLFILLQVQGFGQYVNPKKSTSKKRENLVEKISEDSLHSTFQITIPDKVPLHFHKVHTENIVVIQGKAIMKLGNDTLVIKKGDQVTIPMNTIHEVIRVISKKPLKVYSIQSPKFDGTDRFYINLDF